MSADILKFPVPKVIGTQKRGPEKDRLWFCTSCKHEKFYLDLDGDVWCSWCNAWISNLKVSG